MIDFGKTKKRFLIKTLYLETLFLVFSKTSSHNSSFIIIMNPTVCTRNKMALLSRHN